MTENTYKPIKIYDTHCHYNLEPNWSQREEYLAAAQAAGVAGATVVGTDQTTNARALALVEQHPEYFRASIGLHPEIVTEAVVAGHDPEKTIRTRLAAFQDQLARGGASAIGEIGLDYYRCHQQSEFDKLVRFQEELFRRQLVLARRHQLPIILHLRDDDARADEPGSAYLRSLDLIRECDCQDQVLIFHCFSGGQAHLRRVLSLPHAYVSFAGNLTFKSAQGLRHLCAQVPADRLLLETDSPYLSPEPVRGQPCQPAFIAHTARLAASLGVDLEQVYRNSLAIFGQNSV